MPETPNTRTVVVMTDHESEENSREVVKAAVVNLTGKAPVCIDAREFMTGGPGQAIHSRGCLTLRAGPGDFLVQPDIVIVYEIHPNDRRRFEDFQAVLKHSGLTRMGAADTQAWWNATDKSRTVACFRRDNIPHADTITLRFPSADIALAAFERLGRDVWTRPITGLGGNDVFHVTTKARLREVLDYYAATRQHWLISKDARNINSHGRRHQYRVVVAYDQILRVCEHIQDNPDEPCNESRGAISTVLPHEALPPEHAELAIAATRSVGLPFGGVDLAIENGGAVFEVNLHPVLNVPGGLETVAIPFVKYHLYPQKLITVPNPDQFCCFI